MNTMRKGFYTLLVILLVATMLQGQISSPQVEAVYGGRINAITGFAMHPDTTRIFITTESANTAFYSDITGSGSATRFGKFRVLKALDMHAGFGPSVQKIGVCKPLRTLVFYHHGNGLKYTDPTYSTVHSIYNGNIEDFIIADSMVFWTSGPQLFWGKFTGTGSFVSAAGAPLMLPSGGMLEMELHPVNGQLYLLYPGNLPKLYKTSDIFSAINSGTTFTDISPAISSTPRWVNLGIAPDGRIFLGGNFNNKWIAYTDDEISWTNYRSAIGGINGKNFAFDGTSGTYHVYYASMYNSNKGVAGHWFNFGQVGGFMTHANDGPVFADPRNPKVVLMTTDQGIGASMNKGEKIFEIDKGVEAIQVMDFDMTGDKNTGWLAAKSGIRRVNNYLSSPLWTHAMFPTNDGSPYFSVEMNPAHHDTVFAGNVRIYRSMDDGQNWMRVFTAEHAPYNFPNVGSEVSSIEVCPYHTDIVMAGYHINGPSYGGLFVSEDNGGTWKQILLGAVTTGNDVDVLDIEFTEEAGKIVAYVGVDAPLHAPNGWSIYRVEYTGSGWSVTQDMGPTGTSTGSAIVATINDIEVSSTGDTLFAAGTDAAGNHPVAYYKPLNSTGLWTPFSTSGFPLSGGKTAKAITIGHDTVYIAIDNELYYYDMITDSIWEKGYIYPNGTQINVLYFDDLLVGTGTGLYGHPSTDITSSVREVGHYEYGDWLRVYPNPINTTAILKINAPEGGIGRIEIFNLLGQRQNPSGKYSFFKGDNRIELDFTGLAQGIYIIQASINGQVTTQKVMLAR